MKKIIVFALALVMAQVCTAQMYWTVYQFETKPGQSDDVAAAFEKFFTSETGKKMPYVSLSENLFSSSTDKFSHTLLFATDSKAAFGEMYSGHLNSSADFNLLGMTLDVSINPVASYLGRSMVMGPDTDNPYSTVYELSITDAEAYAAAFSKFRTAILAETGDEMGLDLHTFLSGAEQGATHVAVASAPNFKDLLDFTEITFSSQAYKDFNEAVKDIREIRRVWTSVRTHEWNEPDGM